MEASQSQPVTATASPATSDAQPSAAWTPGPWRLEPFSEHIGPHEFRKLAVRGVRPIAGIPVDEPIADLYAELGDANADANARLIAAAPELYEALRLLVADVADYPAWQRPCHALDVALAALSKAETK